MKHGNVLAASLIAATFAILALSPLTRNALRFDARMAAGKPILGGVLTDLGVKQSEMPFGGFGPRLSAGREDGAVPSAELSVRLASAMHLTGRTKWAALQQLVADFPESPAAHAALARIACKNGGTVDVGHSAEQEELFARDASASAAPTRHRKNPGDPRDPYIMLRSCAAGERLDPDNAYFPAMAAIAHYAANQDMAARAALHRAANKPLWREYFEVEAAGRVRRAELLQGPQNSLTESATLAGMLFPHYAGLRSMARVATVQAMRREIAGDIEGGLALRRDVARVGETMRSQSSSLIGNLVGTAIVGVSEQRPGGTPLLPENEAEGETYQSRTHLQFLEYLARHGAWDERDLWMGYSARGKETREIVRRASFVSTFGAPTLFQTQWRLMANLLLLGAATLLCLLGGIALLRPCLGAGWGRAASAVSVTAFIVLLLWGVWNALGNLRDILAFGSLIQGLSGDSATDPALALAEKEMLLRALYTEGSLCLAALLTLPIYLTAVALSAKRRAVPMSLLLSRWTLPLAALFTLAYAAHLTAFSLRERTVRAELQQVIAHEGRYVAEKLGKAWP
jgi:hypothetical protein